MQKKIIIKKSRELVVTDIDGNLTNSDLGVMGENNATILLFETPNDINGETIDNFEMRAVFNDDKGSHVVDVVDNMVTLSADLTTSTELSLTVQFLKGSEIKWISFPRGFLLFPAADDSGKNIIEDTRTVAMQPLNIIVNYLKEKYDERIEKL